MAALRLVDEDFQHAGRRHVAVLVGHVMGRTQTLDEVLVVVAQFRQHPFGIDISSGIEDSPGIKSMEKMTRIIRRIEEVLQNEKAAR